MHNNLLSTIDPATFDTSINPADDLYGYVNGQFLKNHVIADDRPADGSFLSLRDGSEKHCLALIEDCISGKITGEDASKISILYQAFMDEDNVEVSWGKDLAELTAPIQAAQSHKDFALAWAKLFRDGVFEGFISSFVDVDPNDPNSYINAATQEGISLPERAYYLEDIYEPVRRKFVKHVAKMLELASWASGEEATQVANDILDFETQLAQAQWDNVKIRDAHATNNIFSWEQMVEALPDFPLQAWREASTMPDKFFKKVQVWCPDFFVKASQIWAKTNLETLKWWARWHILHDIAPLCGKTIVEENFNFFSRTLFGTKELRPRWKRAVGLVESTMGMALGRIYVEKHFPPEHRKKMMQLVEDLLAAYRDSITKLEWMSEETKANALKKLNSFVTKIAYPDKWIDYSKLDVSQPTVIAKDRSASRWGIDYWLDKLGGQVDQSLWHMTPQTVNAYYNPSANEIVFPAGILQPPMFDPQADEAINYGAIGAVIGHEIGHGFDDQGSKYDETGALKNWWSAQDQAEFDRRTKALITQYSSLTPRDLDEKYKVDGALTIGENIGDLGGISIAWKAYLLHLQRLGISDASQAPEIDSLSAAKRFFYSWAKVWEQKSHREYQIQLLAIDPHSPNEFRCNTIVSNLDLFAQTFEVKPENKLWRKPEERVKIW